MITLTERLANETEQWSKAAKLLSHEIRVAMPGIIQSFDPVKQTVVVQVAITEQMLNPATRVPIPTTIGVISDVPIYMPRAGGFSLTMPVKAGDECLLIFADACIDAWWQSGGTQNQIELRRHDLSDAFAILGPWNQQRVLPNYSTTAAQLRSDDGNTVIEVGSGEVTIKAATVNVQATGTATVSGQQVNVTGSQKVTISGNSQTTIDGKNFLTHTHSGVTAGGGVTGPVVP
jgi:hypothetical protein